MMETTDRTDFSKTVMRAEDISGFKSKSQITETKIQRSPPRSTKNVSHKPSYIPHESNENEEEEEVEDLEKEEEEEENDEVENSTSQQHRD